MSLTWHKFLYCQDSVTNCLGVSYYSFLNVWAAGYSNLWRGVASIIGFLCVCVLSMLFFGYYYNCIILGMLISHGFDQFFLGRRFDSPLLRKIFSRSTYPGNWELSTEGHVFKCWWCWMEFRSIVEQSNLRKHAVTLHSAH